MTAASVRIYTQALALMAEVDDYESLIFTQGWYRPGDFAITIPRARTNAAEFIKGRIVEIDRNEQKVGIITSVKTEISEDGTRMLTASGVELLGIFEWRLVYPPSGYARWEHQGDVETILKRLVKEQVGADAPVIRQFSALTVAVDLERDPWVLVSARYSLLSEELEEAALSTGCGPFLSLDSGSIIFDIRFGVDRTATQSVNGRAIFSLDHDTIKSGMVMHSDTQFRNFALVGGQGEGASRALEEVYDGTEPSGFTRREMFVDARDLADPLDLPGRGTSKLAEMAAEDYLEVEILNYSSLTLGTDYNLGDIVTVEIEDEMLDARISEISESWDAEGYALTATFGQPMPTISSTARKNNTEVARTLSATEIA